MGICIYNYMGVQRPSDGLQSYRRGLHLWVNLADWKFIGRNSFSSPLYRIHFLHANKLSRFVYTSGHSFNRHYWYFANTFRLKSSYFCRPVLNSWRQCVYIFLFLEHSPIAILSTLAEVPPLERSVLKRFEFFLYLWLVLLLLKINL